MSRSVSNEDFKAQGVEDVQEMLEKCFDAAFSAPDGIKKLRELILTLAMQGKLVEQDPNDPPASELLKEIEREKGKLTQSREDAKGRRGKDKKLPPIRPDEVPYELPKGWEWTRLEDIAPMPLSDGDWIESKDQDPDGEIRLIQLADVGENVFKNVSDRFINSDTFNRLKCTELSEGDILIARLPNPIGRACIFPKLSQRSITVVDVAILRSFGLFNERFIVYAINSNGFRTQVEAYGKGATRFRIATGNLKTILVALPPLPEQQRIVEKIDQLMERCDELERLRAERDKKRLEVHRAAIKNLLDEASSSSPGVFAPLRETPLFLAEHFGELYSVRENVAELRKAILQLAVMGRLVPQDPSDPPASELLKEIEAEKQKLVKEGKIKMPKPLPPIKLEELPYELSMGWVWTRLGSILSFGPTNGFSPKAVEYETIVRSLTLSATTSGVFKGEHSKFIANEISEDSHLWLDDGDILVQRGNTIDYVGVPAVYRGASKQYIYPDLMMKLRVFSSICINYTHLAMSSEYCRQYLRNHASGTSGTMPKISQATLRCLPLPLPPLSEQHRIVAKIDQLMSLCDTLEQQIDSAKAKQSELLNSLMSGICNPGSVSSPDTAPHEAIKEAVSQ